MLVVFFRFSDKIAHTHMDAQCTHPQSTNFPNKNFIYFTWWKFQSDPLQFLLKHMRKHTRLIELQIELINYIIFKLLILNFNWKCCTFHSISSSALSSLYTQKTDLLKETAKWILCSSIVRSFHSHSNKISFYSEISSDRNL